jgi:diguanylate cyclase (GGDEF)-like protein
MAKPRIRIPDPVDNATEVGLDEVPDLVGWSLDTRLGYERPLTSGQTRQVLAAVLGVDEGALAGFTPEALDRALSRIRSLLSNFERLEEAAAHDDLTGALRRGSGMVALQREIDRSRRLGGRGLVVAFIDVDGLKQVNDTLGHAAGDRLLRDVVAAILERVRSYDIVFRYGGDEFVCGLVDVSLEQARRTIRDIRRNIAARYEGARVSVGLSAYKPGDDASRLLHRADAALYEERARVRGSDRSRPLAVTG